MGQSVRVPITNVFMDGDYTGQILVGAAKKPLNVILDTGSSALSLDAKKYEPSHGDTTTKLAQADSYGDGSGWTGAVIQTTVMVGSGTGQVVLPQANAAVAYQATANMFRGADGILGLAYSPLDDAYEMPADTWTTKYQATDVQTGKKTTIAPYLTELASANVTSDIVSFYTKRSQVHQGAGGAGDPLNQGIMIIGGGQDAKDLYTGGLQTVKVLADAWYCTNLKAILVGSSTINVPARGAKGMPSNSIVDSGTNSLNLPETLLRAIAAKFKQAQQTQFLAGLEGKPVSAATLNLPSWPTISFILQADTGEVTLNVSPDTYWQIDTGKVGEAALGFTPGAAGLSILGLPLMNGYFTIFDGEADGGKGAVLFATRT